MNKTTSASANRRAPRRYGKVAVLHGGKSTEREISLESGVAAHAALRRQGVDAHLFDTGVRPLSALAREGFARAFVALHGRGGEDGVAQGALQSLAVPYTGSGVLGSALAMDKTRSKWIWQRHGLSTPAFVEATRAEELAAAARLRFPLMVKPVSEGSSYGASKVARPEELEAAWRKAAAFDSRVLCEEWISGGEYTIGIVGEQALPVIKLETRREFYDYEAKYLDTGTRYICPCGLEREAERRLGELGLRAFRLLDASGWGRVDVMLAADGTPFLIEANTVPGMTSHSLVPMAAKQAGIGFDELVLRILDSSFAAASGGASVAAEATATEKIA